LKKEVFSKENLFFCKLSKSKKNVSLRWSFFPFVLLKFYKYFAPLGHYLTIYNIKFWKISLYKLRRSGIFIAKIEHLQYKAPAERHIRIQKMSLRLSFFSIGFIEIYKYFASLGHYLTIYNIKL